MAQANPHSVSFHTLGCKLNFSETSSLARSLREEGFDLRNWGEAADCYVLNTCSVTDNADRKCRAAVRYALRKNPDARVIVTGCYAQLRPVEIARIPGVDLVLGAAEKFRLVEHVSELLGRDITSDEEREGEYRCGEIDQVEDFVATWSTANGAGDRTRTFLKVQDGCDYSCTFCTIPKARGRSRSDSIENVVNRVRGLSAEGTKEVVLTGINLGDFGMAPGPRPEHGASRRVESFFDLIQELDQIEDVGRYRISSIEPNLLSMEMIDFISESKRFVPHLHIPLQSGCDEILAAMKRRYRRQLYADRVQRIRERMPDACIGVDVIVGFPGESEKHFEETRDFLLNLEVDYFHVFPYSERPGTPAIELDGIVPQQERIRRSKDLRNLSARKRRAFYESQTGSIRTILFEGAQHNFKESGELAGFSDNYVKVRTNFDPSLVGQFAEVRLGRPSADGVVDITPVQILSRVTV